jgi:hypothetical protein
VGLVTRRKTPPDPQDEALLDVNLQPAGERRKVGRVERRVAEAARAARKAGNLDATDTVLVGAELALAEAIDYSSRTKKPGWEYAVAANARELLKVHDVLTRRHPAAVGDGGDDAVADALRELGTPTLDG